ncbi:hypothetical protein BVRB_3g051390 [Beta vulgaris subsp. vulgaris]|nr:hypothetical protein BVRB_3g051390 [Beta vulgaris subsp. vulgaris]
MAEPLSTGIVQAVVQRPISKAYEEIMSALVDFKSNMESLQNTRSTLEAVLLDADSVVEPSHAQKDAIEKLSCQVDRLVDLLDAREDRAMRKQVMGGSWFIKEARLFFSPSNQLVARFMDARKVKDIRNKLDSSSRDHAQFGSIISMPSASQPQAWGIQTVTSHIITDMVVGREEDKENVISKIIPDNYVASETLSVASIVGIGGVGKTTLARYVYNDERVKHSFDVQFWVDVTRDFDVKEVLEKIARYAISDQEPLMSEMNQPYQYHDGFIPAIIGKKFLLVLDNMWDQQGLRLKWMELQTQLDRFGASGSKVLITTRNAKVAGIMDSKHPYMLRDLTEGNSWLLFKQVAFTWWQEPGMETIGKEIAKLCPNVPLVIRSVAGLLAGKRTIREWQAFRDDQLANFASYGRDVNETLKLSFDQLDARSKLCVTYCSLFPKGFYYVKDTIINLWISMGYVEPQYRNQSLEEAGEDILTNLLNSGFLQIQLSNTLGFIHAVVMHDVMHDLVLSLAGVKYKMADSSTTYFDKKVQHVSIGKVVADSSWEVPSSLFKIERLYSFIVVMDLRTLDTFIVSERSSQSESKANGIGRLADLKELNNIKGTLEIKVRKESRDIVAEAKAANLKMKAKLTHFLIDFEYSSKEDEMVLEGLQPHANLKVLRVDGYGGERLPRWMMDDQLHCRLPNLVRISISNCKSCRHLCSLGWLPHLQDMYLDGMDNVEYIENNSSSSGANNSENNVGDELFPNLKRLSIHGMPKLKGWRMSSYDNQDLKQLSQIQDQHQLVQWKPACPKLEELAVGDAESAITIAKSLLTGCLSLQNLSLHKNLTILLPQQRQTLVLLNNTFPTLRKLLLNGIDELEILPVEFQDYSSLKSLNIRFCKQFREIPEWIDKLMSLENIGVRCCPKLESLPHQISNLSKLRTLQVYESSSLLEERCQKPSGECWPYIQHIPHVYITTAVGWEPCMGVVL